MPGGDRSSAARFLDEHPDLREAREQSKVWPEVKKTAELSLPGRQAYIVQGDILGDEDDLYLDRLARGARSSGSDPLSRKLFSELPEELQKVVLGELLRPPQ
jgi:hypothetical protein